MKIKAIFGTAILALGLNGQAFADRGITTAGGHSNSGQAKGHGK